MESNRKPIEKKLTLKELRELAAEYSKKELKKIREELEKLEKNPTSDQTLINSHQRLIQEFEDFEQNLEDRLDKLRGDIFSIKAPGESNADADKAMLEKATDLFNRLSEEADPERDKKRAEKERKEREEGRKATEEAILEQKTEKEALIKGFQELKDDLKKKRQKYRKIVFNIDDSEDKPKSLKEYEEIKLPSTKEDEDLDNNIVTLEIDLGYISAQAQLRTKEQLEHLKERAKPFLAQINEIVSKEEEKAKKAKETLPPPVSELDSTAKTANLILPDEKVVEAKVKRDLPLTIETPKVETKKVKTLDSKSKDLSDNIKKLGGQLKILENQREINAVSFNTLKADLTRKTNELSGLNTTEKQKFEILDAKQKIEKLPDILPKNEINQENLTEEDLKQKIKTLKIEIEEINKKQKALEGIRSQLDQIQKKVRSTIEEKNKNEKKLKVDLENKLKFINNVDLLARLHKLRQEKINSKYLSVEEERKFLSFYRELKNKINVALSLKNDLQKLISIDLQELKSIFDKLEKNFTMIESQIELTKKINALKSSLQEQLDKEDKNAVQDQQNKEAEKVKGISKKNIDALQLQFNTALSAYNTEIAKPLDNQSLEQQIADRGKQSQKLNNALIGIVNQLQAEKNEIERSRSELAYKQFLKKFNQDKLTELRKKLTERKEEFNNEENNLNKLNKLNKLVFKEKKKFTDLIDALIKQIDTTLPLSDAVKSVQSSVDKLNEEIEAEVKKKEAADKKREEEIKKFEKKIAPFQKKEKEVKVEIEKKEETEEDALKNTIDELADELDNLNLDVNKKRETGKTGKKGYQLTNSKKNYELTNQLELTNKLRVKEIDRLQYALILKDESVNRLEHRIQKELPNELKIQESKLKNLDELEQNTFSDKIRNIQNKITPPSVKVTKLDQTQDDKSLAKFETLENDIENLSQPIAQEEKKDEIQTLNQKIEQQGQKITTLNEIIKDFENLKIEIDDAIKKQKEKVEKEKLKIEESLPSSFAELKAKIKEKRMQYRKAIFNLDDTGAEPKELNYSNKTPTDLELIATTLDERIRIFERGLSQYEENKQKDLMETINATRTLKKIKKVTANLFYQINSVISKHKGKKKIEFEIVPPSPSETSLKEEVNDIPPPPPPAITSKELTLEEEKQKVEVEKKEMQKKQFENYSLPDLIELIQEAKNIFRNACFKPNGETNPSGKLEYLDEKQNGNSKETAIINLDKEITKFESELSKLPIEKRENALPKIQAKALDLYRHIDQMIFPENPADKITAKIKVESAKNKKTKQNEVEFAQKSKFGDLLPAKEKKKQPSRFNRIAEAFKSVLPGGSKTSKEKQAAPKEDEKPKNIREAIQKAKDGLIELNKDINLDGENPKKKEPQINLKGENAKEQETQKITSLPILNEEKNKLNHLKKSLEKIKSLNESNLQKNIPHENNLQKSKTIDQSIIQQSERVIKEIENRITKIEKGEIKKDVILNSELDRLKQDLKQLHSYLNSTVEEKIKFPFGNINEITQPSKSKKPEIDNVAKKKEQKLELEKNNTLISQVPMGQVPTKNEPRAAIKKLREAMEQLEKESEAEIREEQSKSTPITSTAVTPAPTPTAPEAEKLTQHTVDVSEDGIELGNVLNELEAFLNQSTTEALETPTSPTLNTPTSIPAPINDVVSRNLTDPTKSALKKEKEAINDQSNLETSKRSATAKSEPQSTSPIPIKPTRSSTPATGSQFAQTTSTTSTTTSTEEITAPPLSPTIVGESKKEEVKDTPPPEENELDEILKITEQAEKHLEKIYKKLDGLDEFEPPKNLTKELSDIQQSLEEVEEKEKEEEAKREIDEIEKELKQITDQEQLINNFENLENELTQLWNETPINIPPSPPAQEIGSGDLQQTTSTPKTPEETAQIETTQKEEEKRKQKLDSIKAQLPDKEKTDELIKKLNQISSDFVQNNKNTKDDMKLSIQLTTFIKALKAFSFQTERLDKTDKNQLTPVEEHLADIWGKSIEALETIQESLNKKEENKDATGMEQKEENKELPIAEQTQSTSPTTNTSIANTSEAKIQAKVAQGEEKDQVLAQLTNETPINIPPSPPAPAQEVAQNTGDLSQTSSTTKTTETPQTETIQTSIQDSLDKKENENKDATGNEQNEEKKEEGKKEKDDEDKDKKGDKKEEEDNKQKELQFKTPKELKEYLNKKRKEFRKLYFKYKLEGKVDPVPLDNTDIPLTKESIKSLHDPIITGPLIKLDSDAKTLEEKLNEISELTLEIREEAKGLINEMQGHIDFPMKLMNILIVEYVPTTKPLPAIEPEKTGEEANLAGEKPKDSTNTQTQISNVKEEEEQEIKLRTLTERKEQLSTTLSENIKSLKELKEHLENKRKTYLDTKVIDTNNLIPDVNKIIEDITKFLDQSPSEEKKEKKLGSLLEGMEKNGLIDTLARMEGALERQAKMKNQIEEIKKDLPKDNLDALKTKIKENEAKLIIAFPNLLTPENLKKLENLDKLSPETLDKLSPEKLKKISHILRIVKIYKDIQTFYETLSHPSTVPSEKLNENAANLINRVTLAINRHQGKREKKSSNLGTSTTTSTPLIKPTQAITKLKEKKEEKEATEKEIAERLKQVASLDKNLKSRVDTFFTKEFFNELKNSQSPTELNNLWEKTREIQEELYNQLNLQGNQYPSQDTIELMTKTVNEAIVEINLAAQKKENKTGVISTGIENIENVGPSAASIATKNDKIPDKKNAEDVEKQRKERRERKKWKRNNKKNKNEDKDKTIVHKKTNYSSIPSSAEKPIQTNYSLVPPPPVDQSQSVPPTSTSTTSPQGSIDDSIVIEPQSHLLDQMAKAQKEQIEKLIALGYKPETIQNMIQEVRKGEVERKAKEEKEDEEAKRDKETQIFVIQKHLYPLLDTEKNSINELRKDLEKLRGDLETIKDKDLKNENEHQITLIDKGLTDNKIENEEVGFAALDGKNTTDLRDLANSIRTKTKNLKSVLEKGKAAFQKIKEKITEEIKKQEEKAKKDSKDLENVLIKQKATLEQLKTSFEKAKKDFDGNEKRPLIARTNVTIAKNLESIENAIAEVEKDLNNLKQITDKEKLGPDKQFQALGEFQTPINKRNENIVFYKQTLTDVERIYNEELSKPHQLNTIKSINYQMEELATSIKKLGTDLLTIIIKLTAIQNSINDTDLKNKITGQIEEIKLVLDNNKVFVSNKNQAKSTIPEQEINATLVDEHKVRLDKERVKKSDLEKALKTAVNQLEDLSKKAEPIIELTKAENLTEALRLEEKRGNELKKKLREFSQKMNPYLETNEKESIKKKIEIQKLKIEKALEDENEISIPKSSELKDQISFLENEIKNAKKRTAALKKIVTEVDINFVKIKLQKEKSDRKTKRKEYQNNLEKLKIKQEQLKLKQKKAQEVKVKLDNLDSISNKSGEKAEITSLHTNLLTNSERIRGSFLNLHSIEEAIQNELNNKDFDNSEEKSNDSIITEENINKELQLADNAIKKFDSEIKIIEQEINTKNKVKLQENKIALSEKEKGEQLLRFKNFVTNNLPPPEKKALDDIGTFEELQLKVDQKEKEYRKEILGNDGKIQDVIFIDEKSLLKKPISKTGPLEKEELIRETNELGQKISLFKIILNGYSDQDKKNPVKLQEVKEIAVRLFAQIDQFANQKLLAEKKIQELKEKLNVKQKELEDLNTAFLKRLSEIQNKVPEESKIKWIQIIEKERKEFFNKLDSAVKKGKSDGKEEKLASEPNPKSLLGLHNDIEKLKEQIQNHTKIYTKILELVNQATATLENINDQIDKEIKEKIKKLEETIQKSIPEMEVQLQNKKLEFRQAFNIRIKNDLPGADYSLLSEQEKKAIILLDHKVIALQEKITQDKRKFHDLSESELSQKVKEFELGSKDLIAQMDDKILRKNFEKSITKTLKKLKDKKAEYQKTFGIKVNDPNEPWSVEYPLNMAPEKLKGIKELMEKTIKSEVKIEKLKEMFKTHAKDLEDLHIFNQDLSDFANEANSSIDEMTKVIEKENKEKEELKNNLTKLSKDLKKLKGELTNRLDDKVDIKNFENKIDEATQKIEGSLASLNKLESSSPGIKSEETEGGKKKEEEKDPSKTPPPPSGTPPKKEPDKSLETLKEESKKLEEECKKLTQEITDAESKSPELPAIFNARALTWKIPNERASKLAIAPLDRDKTRALIANKNGFQTYLNFIQESVKNANTDDDIQALQKEVINKWEMLKAYEKYLLEIKQEAEKDPTKKKQLSDKQKVLLGNVTESLKALYRVLMDEKFLSKKIGEGLYLLNTKIPYVVIDPTTNSTREEPPRTLEKVLEDFGVPKFVEEGTKIASTVEDKVKADRKDILVTCYKNNTTHQTKTLNNATIFRGDKPVAEFRTNWEELKAEKIFIDAPRTTAKFGLKTTSIPNDRIMIQAINTLLTLKGRNPKLTTFRLHGNFHEYGTKAADFADSYFIAAAYLKKFLGVDIRVEGNSRLDKICHYRNSGDVSNEELDLLVDSIKEDNKGLYKMEINTVKDKNDAIVEFSKHHEMHPLTPPEDQPTPPALKT